MSLPLILGSLVFVATLVLVIGRPGGFPEWAAALLGGAAMLVLGIVSVGQAAAILSDNLNVFGFFLGLMTISAIAEGAGFFDTLARLSVRLSGESATRLMVNVMLIGVLITTFLTNDATALILTPLVYALVVRLRLEPLPFMFATTFIADTASFVLPVSNPINVLVLTTFPRDLGNFLLHLLLAAALVITANVVAFLVIFRSDLHRRFDPELIAAMPDRQSGPYFWFVVGSLGAIAVAYLLASTFRWPISLVALGGSAWLLAAAFAARRVRWRKLASEISWPIFGFIGGMLVMVQGIENLGLTAGFGRWLVGLSGGQSWGAVLASVFGAAIGSNAINNVPMALVLISSIRSAAPPGQIQDLFVYGTIVGADLGPNITTVGSLATMLWLLILRRKGMEVSPMAYFRLGVTVTPILLALGALALWLSSLF